MKCRIIRTQDEDGAEILQGYGYPDEIAERFNLPESELERMRYELRYAGRYWIDARTCARASR